MTINLKHRPTKIRIMSTGLVIRPTEQIQHRVEEIREMNQNGSSGSTLKAERANEKYIILQRKENEGKKREIKLKTRVKK